jgi:ethanolamine permease
MGDKDRSERVASSLDAIITEVVAEAHLRPEELRPEERAYLKEHALKKPLRVLDIWALGVGAVITGAYFGWNLGLKDNGPVAMLIASLLVCLLYLTWVLALAELSVAMPFAGGPLAYGRRTSGPLLGFVMGWSMFLECQFAAIATTLALGGYIASLVNPDEPSPALRVGVALAAVVIFFVLHAWGVKEQSWVMMVMTYGAIFGLLIFWAAAVTHFSGERVWPTPALPAGKGWRAVLEALPFALWWLVIIETVALAAEEAHEAHRTIPRGLLLAQLTLIGLVVLTWLFACGALDSQELAVSVVDGKETDVDYPLLKALAAIPAGRDSALLRNLFGTIAIFGIIASYHGMVYGTSRQAFAFGRAGYLPSFLGGVHVIRRTPVPALFACSLLTAVFVVASLWWENVGTVAVLVSTLTALIWYILAMGCLFILRRREPRLFDGYRAPVARVLPLTVVVLSAFAVFMYGIINVQVIPLTLGLYAGGLGYFWFWARRRLQQAAPEELTASRAVPGAVAETGKPGGQESRKSKTATLPLLVSVTGFVLLLVLLALGWMGLAAWQPEWSWGVELHLQVWLILGLLTAALVLVSIVALQQTRPSKTPEETAAS